MIARPFEDDAPARRGGASTGGSSSSTGGGGSIGANTPRSLADGTTAPGSGTGSAGGGILANSINADLGVRIESLGDAPPPSRLPTQPEPFEQALAIDPLTTDPITPAPDTTTTALVDPATSFRDDSRFHQLAADAVDLRHL